MQASFARLHHSKYEQNFITFMNTNMRSYFPGLSPDKTICTVIKQNQSKVGNIDFKIEPNKAENVFCYLLFFADFNCSYLQNNWPISVGFSAKCSHNNGKYS